MGLRDSWLELVRLGRLLRVGGRLGAALVLRALAKRPLPHAALGARLRRFCERMGITYIKLGQFLAMRFDLLPPEVCQELENLFEVVEPLAPGEVQRVIASELGAPVHALYADFEEAGLAAGSVAQVHRARLHGGEAVAVKVQRPGIESLFRADIRLLRRLARLVDATGVLRRLSAVEWVDEFESFTLRELDFETEGRTADRLREQAAPYEHIPRVHWALTSRCVLTLDFVEGVSVARVCQLLDRGQEDVLARLLPHTSLEECMHHFSSASFRQLFSTGFFHGDPHPGNVFFRADGSVAFLDFGIFGALTPRERRTVSAMIENLALGNVEASFHHYAQMSTPTPRTDREAFRRESLEVMRTWYRASSAPDAPVVQRHMGKYFGKMLEVFRVQHRKMEADQLLFWRALLTLDSTALRMSGHFDLLGALQDFFREQQPGPAGRLADALEDPDRFMALCELLALLPGLVRGLGSPPPPESPGLAAKVEQGSSEEAWALRPLLLATAGLTALICGAGAGHGLVAQGLLGLWTLLLLAAFSSSVRR